MAVFAGAKRVLAGAKRVLAGAKRRLDFPILIDLML